ncbi:formate--tetrahydrofolate ligase [Corynebacterium heidelbergense]|uniref:Formate--tetrahydrofolate ligase n=1 Tax=Corynebacterium heidelbergense TaxID=2055947 RepID=A0A364VCK0_9CORY|nr:formate--tetrahydrofolate ligase [Corynebacterium heidelbergense]RAV34361.1 formate--tetrahydrofolate ligase [Corynebacterium heidelbergense]
MTTTTAAHTQPSDVQIAQAHHVEPMETIAERAGIPAEALIPYGRNKAKVDVGVLERAGVGVPNHNPADPTPPQSRMGTGRLVLVTAMSPTPAGEGKSTTLIGLADALRAAGRRTIVTLREPSLGPVLGMKGGAAGGGYSQVVPMEDINLHFTGDMHAITAANNTRAALIDNHIHHGNALGIDPRRITWRRCLDVNDRNLRHIVTGLGGPGQGLPGESGFDITAASEIMAILCLARDHRDLRERLGRIVIGQTFDRSPITADDLGAQGAMAALLKDATLPNLVQTLGGTPALVHGGPFANIAHGCNSLIATTTAQKLADVVLTEAGFGADLGAEKFFDIAARAGGVRASAVVVVATIRSLKFNGGGAREDLHRENVAALQEGLSNLTRHIRGVRKFGVKPVVALNVFTSDTAQEREAMRAWAADCGVRMAEATVWANGGAGARELAQAVGEVLDGDDPASSHPLYNPALGIEAALDTIAREIYGAADVRLDTVARRDLAFLADNGWDRLPVCVSKTQYSFSEDPSALGAPEGHTLHVRRLLPRVGAGFVVALTGDVMTMPGLPKAPAAQRIDVDEDGVISGLF